MIYNINYNEAVCIRGQQTNGSCFVNASSEKEAKEKANKFGLSKMSINTIWDSETPDFLNVHDLYNTQTIFIDCSMRDVKTIYELNR